MVPCALACLADELLTGRNLLPAKSVPQLAQDKLTLTLPPAAEIGGGASADLYEFLQRALRVNPDERPSSAEPFIEWAARCDPPPEDLVDEQGRS